MKKQTIGVCLAMISISLASLACSVFNKPSPTAVFKSFVDAAQKKDWDAMKKTLSKDSVSKMEDMAKTLNMSVSDLMKEDKKELKTVPETRNEKINGDKATLEIKDPDSNNWEEWPFVKEDGDWKIDLLNQKPVK
jgi:hypothetical protein